LKTLALIFAALLITGCDKNETAPPLTDATPDTASEASIAPEDVAPASTQASLDSILNAQSEETKARYAFRHPKETLEFFRIQPGMTVVEVLPGDGWYSQILVPYLGEQGRLIGLDYDGGMWKNFDWVTDEFMETRKQWPSEWSGKASAWGGENAAQTSAFAMEDAPESLNGTVDAVLFIRALHNFFRFESQGQHLTQALATTNQLLKPGGLVGIVQHQVSEDKTDEWADGSRGYLKKSALVARMEAAGFEFVAESDINLNPKDVPGENDIVWRLPPSYYNSKDDEALKKQFTEIGESNRMTLLFRKPE
jgi:predicted methyltransferase